MKREIFVGYDKQGKHVFEEREVYCYHCGKPSTDVDNQCDEDRKKSMNIKAEVSQRKRV